MRSHLAFKTRQHTSLTVFLAHMPRSDAPTPYERGNRDGITPRSQFISITLQTGHITLVATVTADVTPAVVAEVQHDAHALGLKGITVYRYGSNSEQVLQFGAGEEPYEKQHGARCDPYLCRP